MAEILPPARPKRDAARIRRALDALRPAAGNQIGANAAPPAPPLARLLWVRGHYLSTMGSLGKDDINIYDDACFLFTDDLAILESYNANTNPSFIRRGGRNLAQLNLGTYRFYRGLHRGKYKALRAYPEGVTLPVTRAGKLSTAQYINIHKGSTNSRAHNVTWSEGCLTIPDTQYGDFIQRVYAGMDKYGQDTIDVHLIENRQTPEGQKWFDFAGRVVA